MSNMAYFTSKPAGKTPTGENFYMTPNGMRTDKQILDELSKAQWDNSGNPIEAYDRTSAAAFGMYPMTPYGQRAPSKSNAAPPASTGGSNRPLLEPGMAGMPGQDPSLSGQLDPTQHSTQQQQDPDWYTELVARQQADVDLQHRQAQAMPFDSGSDDQDWSGGGDWVGLGEGEDDGSGGVATDSGGSSGGDTNMVGGQDTNTQSGRANLRDQGYYVDSSGVYAPGAGDRVGNTFGGSQKGSNTADNGNRLPVIGGRPVSPSNGFTGPNTGYIMYRGDPQYQQFFGPGTPGYSSAPHPWAPGQEGSWNGSDPMNYTGSNPKSPDYQQAVASGSAQPSLAAFLQAHPTMASTGLSPKGPQRGPLPAPKPAPQQKKKQLFPLFGMGAGEGDMTDNPDDAMNQSADDTSQTQDDTSSWDPGASTSVPYDSSSSTGGDTSGGGGFGGGWWSNYSGSGDSNTIPWDQPQGGQPNNQDLWTMPSSAVDPGQNLPAGGQGQGAAGMPGFGNTIDDLSGARRCRSAPSLEDWESMGPFGQAALQYGLGTAGYNWAPYSEAMLAGLARHGPVGSEHRHERLHRAARHRARHAEHEPAAAGSLAAKRRTLRHLGRLPEPRAARVADGRATNDQREGVRSTGWQPQPNSSNKPRQPPPPRSWTRSRTR